jgi:hypothetical protein
MSKHVLSSAFFVLAVVCYVMDWFGVAVGLSLVGLLFESLFWVVEINRKEEE